MQSTQPAEITLGEPRLRLIGQSGFLKDGGGGRCSGCGTTWPTLFLDGTGPCCHATASPDRPLLPGLPTGVRRR